MVCKELGKEERILPYPSLDFESTIAYRVKFDRKPCILPKLGIQSFPRWPSMAILPPGDGVR